MFGVRPQWDEVRAAADHDLPAPCLGALMEHAEHHGPPHEVSPVMYGPLVVLAPFAIGLGVAAHPLRELLAPTALEPGGPRAHFALVCSVTAVLIGVGYGVFLYSRDVFAGERRLRAGLGPFWKFLAQKWYMDHLWAYLMSYTMYAGARLAAMFDEKVLDRAVLLTGRLTRLAGNRMRREQSGLIQRYALQIVLSLIVLVWAVGTLEPDFLWSFSRPLQWLLPGGPTDGGLVP